MRMAKEGWRCVLPCLAAAFLFAWPRWWAASLFSLGLAAALAFFFRDPERIIPGEEHAVLSPADGRVLGIESLSSYPSLKSPVTRVTIFLSLLDVHITRSPVSGTVTKQEYRRGRFFPAHTDQAGQKNESHSLSIRGGTVDVDLKQIVGVAARRIRSYVGPGESVKKGQKIGLMCFGSRVEICLPASAVVTIAAGSKVRAGETVIAEVKI